MNTDERWVRVPHGVSVTVGQVGRRRMVSSEYDGSSPPWVLAGEVRQQVYELHITLIIM